jgi:hypothetical protein
MFTTPEEIKGFKKLITKILKDAHPEKLTLNEVCTKFKSLTGTDFRRWFRHADRGVPHALPLFENYLADVAELDKKSLTNKIIVHGKGEFFKYDFQQDIQKLSKVECENKLKATLQNIQGSSKDYPIDLATDNNDHFEFDYKETYIPQTQEFKSLRSEVARFKNYRDFQMVHIAYVKVRLVFLFNQVGRSQLHFHTICALFRQLFNESFFQTPILRHYITSADDRDKDVVTFLKRFCGDFLFINDNGKVSACSSLASLTTTLIQNLYKTLSKVNGLEAPGIPPEITKAPDHLYFLGSKNAKDIQVDVRRCTEFSHFGGGPSNPAVPNFLDFPSAVVPEAYKSGRPSIHDVNDTVSTIRSRLCREHRAIKIMEIIYELCKHYGVASIRDLRPTDYREIRRESDVPALHEIIKLQGKVCTQ